MLYLHSMCIFFLSDLHLLCIMCIFYFLSDFISTDYVYFVFYLICYPQIMCSFPQI